MNPCTLGWYLPLLVKDLPGALQPSDGDRAGDFPALEPGPMSGARPGESNAQGSSQELDRPHRASSGSNPREGHRQNAFPDAPISTVPSGSASSKSGPLAVDASNGSGTVELQQRPRRERGQNELVWRELDAKFRRDLPDEAYIGRLAYRGLVMRACPRIAMLDGVEVERKERDKAERLLRSIFGTGKSRDASREVPAS